MAQPLKKSFSRGAAHDHQVDQPQILSLAYLKKGISRIKRKKKNRKRLALYKNAVSKLSALNLDPLFAALKPYYSTQGRPAKHQSEIFRSLILMVDQGEISLTRWQAKVDSDNILALMIGCKPGHTPPLGSYYDFIDRLWLRSKSIEHENRERLYTFNRKPSGKLSKNKKLPNRNPAVVDKVAKFLLKGRSFDKRPERLVQEVFSLIAVVPSLELGLIDTRKRKASGGLTVSGDGTCLHCHSSSRGIKVCDCRKHGVYDCKCKRRFSDPDAGWGWDSYLGQYFYGHTLYAVSYHNPILKIDLPLLMRFVGANRHDSVSGPVALAELRQLTPELPIRKVCFDSANDNYPTYRLLKHWGILPFIDLNHRGGNRPDYASFTVNDNGVPACAPGREMIFNGLCANRYRLKWRCPLKCGKRTSKGKALSCEKMSSCSPSTYGRVVYTKPDWDSRLFTPVPRDSKEFKDVYKNRTSSERVNNRILNDYNLQNMRIRGKKRFSFFAMVCGVNIHLDARLKLAA